MSDLTAIPIKQIYISPERQRTKPNEAKVAELAMSIQQHGLLQPIVVEPLDRVRFPDAPSHTTHRLLAGYRRLLSHALLKKPEIPFTLKEGLDDLEAEEIELDENLMREELPWQDEVKAKNRILEIRKNKYGEGIREVADHIGDSRGALWEDARLAEAMKVMPALADSKNKTQAQNKLRLALRRATLTEKAEDIKSGKTEVSQDISAKVWLGDSTQLAKNIPSESVHLVLTDPPYGINLDQGETKKGSPHPTIYHDDSYDIHDIYALIAKEAYRVLIPDSHAYFWFDIKAHSKILRLLSEAGFTVEAIPLIWAKPGPGQVNHPDSRWGSGYEACFFCRKGTRSLLKQGQSNILTYDPVPPKKKIHPVEKPVALLRQLIETSTAPGETVVDFFGGSGSTAEAALQTGRDFLVIEKDEAYYAGILERLSGLATNESKPVASFKKGSDDYDPLAALEEEMGGDGD